MVVLFHALQNIPIPLGTSQWQIDRRDGVMKVLGTFGVMSFFFCAGRAQAFNRKKYTQFLQSRALRLLVPFLFAVPLCLQPAQYIACANGFDMLGCSVAYSPGMPYLTFIESWFDNIGNSIIHLHWLWFLPCIFFNDMMNFGTQRILAYYFEGGWYNEQPSPDDMAEADAVSGGFEFLFQRPDVVYALALQLLFQVVTAVLWQTVAQFWFLFWTVQITLIYLLKRLRETKRYEYWFLARCLLPTTSALWTLFWVDGVAESILQTYAIYTFFTNYGFILQLAEPFLETKMADAGTSAKPYVTCIMFFLFCLCLPTSGTEYNPSVPPLYMDDTSSLAMLGLLGSWLLITLTDMLFKTHFNSAIDKFQYHHFKQFCMVAYVVHMLFLVAVIAYVNGSLPGAMSYPLRWIVDVALVFWCCALVYAFLLNYQTTRIIFGLKRYQLTTLAHEESREESSVEMAHRDSVGIPL